MVDQTIYKTLLERFNEAIKDVCFKEDLSRLPYALKAKKGTFDDTISIGSKEDTAFTNIKDVLKLNLDNSTEQDFVRCYSMEDYIGNKHVDTVNNKEYLNVKVFFNRSNYCFIVLYAKHGNKQQYCITGNLETDQYNKFVSILNNQVNSWNLIASCFTKQLLSKGTKTTCPIPDWTNATSFENIEQMFNTCSDFIINHNKYVLEQQKIKQGVRTVKWPY